MTTPAFSARRETDDLIVIEAHGQMDAQAMEVALTLLSDEMAGMAHGDMLILAQGVEMPTLGAVAVELRHWVQLMAMIQKVDRIALVADADWVRSMAAAESALIPGVVIQSFDADDIVGARGWLMEHPATA